MREILFGIALVVASACVVVGVASWSFGLAWIVGGVLLAAVSFLVLSGDDEPVVPGEVGVDE